MRYLLLLHPPLSPARHGPTRFGPFSPQKAPFPPGTSPPFPEPPGPASAAHPTRPRLSRRHLVSATRPWPRFSRLPSCRRAQLVRGVFLRGHPLGTASRRPFIPFLKYFAGSRGITHGNVGVFLSPPVLLCLRALPRSRSVLSVLSSMFHYFL